MSGSDNNAPNEGQEINILANLNCPILCGAANEAERNYKQPLKQIIFTAIGVMAIVSQGLFNVDAPFLGEIPISLLVGVIADSSERKSKIARAFSSFVTDFQAACREKYLQEIEEYKANLKVWSAEDRALEKALGQCISKKQPAEAARRSYHEHQGKKPNEPKRFKLVYRDPTAAALRQGMQDGYSSAGLIATEGDRAFRGHTFNILADINILWDGDDASSERASRPDADSSDVRFSALVLVQPTVLDRLEKGDGGLARGIGFWARFLCCEAGSAAGTRIEPDINPKSEDRLEIFGARIKELMNQNLYNFKNGIKKRGVVCFSHEAKLRLLEEQNRIEKEMLPGGMYEEAKDYGGRMLENIVRVAALLHVFERFEGDISVATLESSIAICEFAASCFMRRFVRPSEEQLQAEALKNWLVAYCQKNSTFTLPRNTALQKGPLRQKAFRDMAIDRLCKQGEIALFLEGSTTMIDVFPEGIYEPYNPKRHGDDPPGGVRFSRDNVTYAWVKHPRAGRLN